MPWDIVVLTLVCVVIAMLPFALLYLRRRWLTGQGGLFDCAYRRREDATGAGWVLGVARYRGENLEWFRSFSLSMRPKMVFPRALTSYVHQRSPVGLEAIALFEDSMIVTLRDRVEPWRSARTVWRCPEAPEVSGPLIASFPEVLHCFERRVPGGMAVLAVIEGESRSEIDRAIERIRIAGELDAPRIAYPLREHVRAPMRFFTEGD